MKNCAGCKHSFEVTQAEKDFLKKIDLPEPAFCPECRMQRRFSFRNERKLYYRKCDLTGKQIVSIYHPNSPYKVYDQHEWYSDKWNGKDYAKDFDFSRPFFQQFGQLMLNTPKISVFTSRNENSDYTNGTQQDKNCYMIFVSDHNEDCYFSYAIDSCESCIECLNCYKCTLCIECIDCSECYNTAFSQKSHNCRDSYFLSDCKNCHNCFGCYGLRNKEYYIFNQKLSMQEYNEKMKQLNTGNIQTLEKAKELFNKKSSQQQIHQYYDGNNNDNVTGDHIVRSRNCTECYDSGDLEDCGHLIFSFKSKDCFDGHVVVDNAELCYETISNVAQYNTQFTYSSWYSKNSMYLDHCVSCQDCFACSGLQQARYCIFNKQYEKEEYENLKAKIVEHMKKHGEWGQMFPTTISPFGYNETVAQEYFPLTKDQVLQKNWKWYEEEHKDYDYQGPKYKIPDDIKEVPDEITEKILTCEKSGKLYKISRQELKLYREKKLLIPRLCFDERHLARIQKRNPKKLWKRSCVKCGKALETTYAPERKETIYCEECYVQELN